VHPSGRSTPGCRQRRAPPWQNCAHLSRRSTPEAGRAPAHLELRVPATNGRAAPSARPRAHNSAKPRRQPTRTRRTAGSRPHRTPAEAELCRPEPPLHPPSRSTPGPPLSRARGNPAGARVAMRAQLRQTAAPTDPPPQNRGQPTAPHPRRGGVMRTRAAAPLERSPSSGPPHPGPQLSRARGNPAGARSAMAHNSAKPRRQPTRTRRTAGSRPRRTSVEAELCTPLPPPHPAPEAPPHPAPGRPHPALPPRRGRATPGATPGSTATPRRRNPRSPRTTRSPATPGRPLSAARLLPWAPPRAGPSPASDRARPRRGPPG
jgi:hypothetical protein